MAWRLIPQLPRSLPLLCYVSESLKVPEISGSGDLTGATTPWGQMNKLRPHIYAGRANVQKCVPPCARLTRVAEKNHLKCTREFWTSIVRAHPVHVQLGQLRTSWDTHARKNTTATLGCILGPDSRAVVAHPVRRPIGAKKLLWTTTASILDQLGPERAANWGKGHC